MSNFGNLENVEKEKWPKITIVITNEVTAPLNLEPNSFSNLYLDTVTVQFVGSPKLIASNAFEGSRIDKLEIKKSSGFAGFEQLPFGSRPTQVNSLIVDMCPGFTLTGSSIPRFDGLTSLTIR